MRNLFTIIVSFSFLTACAMQQKEVAASLENSGPVNCATAEGDVRVLEGEKAHVAQRIIEGVTALAPAGAAMGILTQTEGTKLRVATGIYNDMIEKRIAQIKEECGI